MERKTNLLIKIFSFTLLKMQVSDSFVRRLAKYKIIPIKLWIVTYSMVHRKRPLYPLLLLLLEYLGKDRKKMLLEVLSLSRGQKNRDK